MNAHTRSMWLKAESLRGCLAHRRQMNGRRRYTEKDEDPFFMKNPFVADEAKLLSSKAFRKMKDKTQVFSFPRNAHIRTRQTHVMEVVAVSVIASEMLGVNTDLVRAAAIGHDIGHVPFGHQGEVWMAQHMARTKFCHEIMGPIVAQKIERCGAGLNLTYETLEAMMCHSGNTAREGMSQEAWTLRYTDKFAYIFHDINDIAERMRYPLSAELIELANTFGLNQRERTSTAIAGLVVESAECGRVSFEHSELAQAFKRLRKLMYEVYVCVTQQNVARTMEPILEFLTMLKLGDPYLLMALMTDKDIADIAAQPMKDMGVFNRTAASDIVPHLAKVGPIDLCDPDMNW